MPDEAQTKLPVLDKDALRQLEETVREVRKEISSLTEPVRQSTRLTESDYSIRINARD